MSLMGIIQGKGASGFGWSSTAEEVVEGLDLSGRHILITGCNSGIGLETMRVLAERGATIFAAARTVEKAETAGDAVDGETIAVACELSEPNSVRSCAEEVARHGQPLDAIICNAGIMALPELEQIYGYEKQFFVNHVGHFILVTELLEQLAEDGRVVMVASYGHKFARRGGIEFDNLSGDKGYNGWFAYCQSKLANVLFARELGRRFEEEGSRRVANALHPGSIATNLTRNINLVSRMTWGMIRPLFLKTVEMGAATQTWAAVHPDTAEINGEYLSDCNVAGSSAAGRDMEMAKRLWDETERIVEDLQAGEVVEEGMAS